MKWIRLVQLMTFTILVASILGLAFVSAEVQTLGTFKQNTCIQLLQTCGNCTFNNITSVRIEGNSTSLTSQVVMTRTGTEYNHSFCESNISTKYIVNGFGDPNGETTVWAYDFFVNPTGLETSDANTATLNRAVWFFVIIGLLLLVGVFVAKSMPVRSTLFVLSFIFFLISLNLISVTIQDSVVSPRIIEFIDSFTAISFILYWFAAGLIFIIWILTFLNTIFLKRNVRRMERAEGFGG